MNPADLSNDADPKFLAEFYKNLKILSQDLYKKSAVAQSAVPFMSNRAGGGVDSMMTPQHAPPRSTVMKKLRASFGGKGGATNDLAASMAAAAAAVNNAGGDDMISSSIDMHGHSPARSVLDTPQAAYQTHPADYFTAESLYERMKLYAEQGGIPLDYLERYAAGRGGADSK